MRILVSCTSGEGHLAPLLPLAHALRELDNDVAFAMADDYRPRLEAAGFTWLPSGIGPQELSRRTFPDGEPALPHRLEDVFVARFARGDAPDRAAALHRVVASWRPDLLVFEPCDLAAPVVGAAAEVPTVLHSYGRPMPSSVYRSSAPVVAELWRAAGLPPAPLCGVYDGAYVDICPRALRGDDGPAARTVLPLRPTAPPGPVEPPEWLLRLPDRPTVYVTFGTLFNDPERFALVLEAVEDVECNVVMTVGSDGDPDALGRLRPGVVVERFVPQARLLPHVQAVTNHGGSGSMLATMAHGLPQLMLPRGADQFDNAAAAARTGAARWLPPEDVTAGTVGRELEALMTDDAARVCAQGLALDIAAMPSPHDVALELTTR